MRTFLVAIISVATVSTPTAAQEDFCTALQRVIAAAPEIRAFSSVSGPSLGMSGWKGAVPLWGIRNCDITLTPSSATYHCRTAPMEVAAAQRAVKDLQREVAACMRVTGRVPAPLKAIGGPEELQYAFQTAQGEGVVSVSLFNPAQPRLFLKIKYERRR